MVFPWFSYSSVANSPAPPEALTAVPLRVHRGASLQQQLHDLDVAVARCLQQRSSAWADEVTPRRDGKWWFNGILWWFNGILWWFSIGFYGIYPLVSSNMAGKSHVNGGFWLGKWSMNGGLTTARHVWWHWKVFYSPGMIWWWFRRYLVFHILGIIREWDWKYI